MPRTVIVGQQYGSRIVLSKEPSALKPDGSVSFARYKVRCEACNTEKILSGQGVLQHDCYCQVPKQTHCVRGHLRIPENLIRNNCKLCMKQWNQEHPEERKKIAREYSRRYRRKTLYGLTEEKYQEMFAAQKGLCILPSCGEPIDATDHCHDRGITRGLMCRNHNSGIGFFANSPQLLREAAEYLENFYVK